MFKPAGAVKWAITLVSSVFSHLVHSFRVYFHIFSTRFECIFTIFSTRFECIFSPRTKLSDFDYQPQGYANRDGKALYEKNKDRAVVKSFVTSPMKKVKSTLETSGEDVKLHSKGVRKM
jgi:hypothetical protein